MCDETSLAYRFYAVRDRIVLDPDLPHWDVSRVTNLRYTFHIAVHFDQDLSGWNTSNVTNMEATFWGAKNFNSDVSKWNTSRVTTMCKMFWNAMKFNQDISNWDVSNVTDMSDMFRDAVSFDQNLGSWNVETVENFENMFSFCELSTRNYDALLIGWAKQNVRHWKRFDAGLSKYTPGGAAEAARTKLIREKGWTISDGGTASVPSSSETITTVAGNPCPICFEVSFQWKITPCKHVFCVACLERWTERGNGTCPICRRVIIACGGENSSLWSWQIESIRQTTQRALRQNEIEHARLL